MTEPNRIIIDASDATDDPDAMKDVKMCGRCYDIVDELFPANCSEKPEDLLGQPIGMYHCPDCGAMLLAGVPHPSLCKRCLDRQHPSFDIIISNKAGTS